MAIVLKYATKTKLIAALALAYESSTGLETERLAAKLYDAYFAGDITEAEITAHYSLTKNQFDKFIGDVKIQSDKYKATKAEKPVKAK